MKYIDVSQYQGTIDFDKLKVDGVIILAGYGKNHIDPQFTRNASECNRVGIPCGAYWFSYAKTAEEARNEAKYLLAAVKPYRMELPLCYDFEYASVDNATAQGVTVTKELATSFATAFLSEIEAGGYWALNYANPDYLSRMYDESLTKRFGLWLAAWKLSSKPDLTKPPRACNIWQWGLSTIDGISGAVDTNESYVDFPKAIRDAGLNHLDKIDPAMKWAQSFKLTEDPDIADALYKYHYTFHVGEDYKGSSGLITEG